jgi:hypothetical protein
MSITVLIPENAENMPANLERAGQKAECLPGSLAHKHKQ